ncbi:MAG: sigma-70 family RNA polymerase sigma factor [Lachnospiraceae bacterium]|nr:sigma-70 family RNA polymerase sigma factor [Lachnospiraceae bacterium]
MNADKKQIWIKGQLIEVSAEVYAAYMQGDRKMRYFENDLKTERILMDEDGHIIRVIPSREDSLDRLMDDNAGQFADSRESVEDTVLRRISIEQVHEALAQLTEKDRQLIEALFFQELTERDAAAILGISQPAVHKQKIRILRKLKIFLKK